MQMSKNNPLAREIVPDTLSPTPACRLVGMAGLEPATSSLSGTRSNQLSYTPVSRCAGSGPALSRGAANPLPGPAIPPAPRSLADGGGSRVRTGDIQLAKLALYQLSYTPAGAAAIGAAAVVQEPPVRGSGPFSWCVGNGKTGLRAARSRAGGERVCNCLL